MLTRKNRIDLRRMAEHNLKGITEDLVNDEVYKFSVDICGVLSAVSDRYSSDAIVDLIPVLTLVLNRLDAALTVISDLSDNLKSSNNDIQSLEKCLAVEKKNRREELEVSLRNEDEAGSELALLRSNMAALEKSYKDVVEDLKSKNEIVSLLTKDCSELKNKLYSRNPVHISESDKEFLKPKKSCGLNSYSQNLEVESYNIFSELAVDETISVPPTFETVEAQVHREERSPEIIQCLVSPPRSGGIKRKIMVLADSHGKELSQHFVDFTGNYSSCILSKPGAKLKHVIREGQAMVKNFSDSDYVVTLAGCNDVGWNEPSQLTLHQGLDALRRVNTKSNLIVIGIPYRYDVPALNNKIFYSNMEMKKKIGNHNSKSKMYFIDINHHLERHHYTRHGLHFNKRGKSLIARVITEFINRNFSADVPCNQTPGPSRNYRSRPTVPAVERRAWVVPESPEIQQLPISRLTSPSPHQPHGVSVNVVSEDEPFHLSMPDFPPLPPSSMSSGVGSVDLSNSFLEESISLVGVK